MRPQRGPKPSVIVPCAGQWRTSSPSGVSEYSSTAHMRADAGCASASAQRSALTRRMARESSSEDLGAPGSDARAKERIRTIDSARRQLLDAQPALQLGE